MTGITLFLLLLCFRLHKTDEVVNDLVSVVEKAQLEPAPSNQSWLVVKEPSLLLTEPLEKNGQESKFALHPLPSAVWPKHSDLAPLLRHHGHHGLHDKSRKALKNDRLHEHNGEKVRQAVGLLPKPPLAGTAASTTAVAIGNNRTAQKTNQDGQSNISSPPQSEQNQQPNSRSRGPVQPQAQAQAQAQAQPHHPTPPPRKELLARRLNPEENRPGKASFYQAFVGAESRNSSRLPVTFNRRSSSLLYQFDLLRRESDFTHDAFCMSECRKEKDEREFYCHSDFAVNGVVHDIEVLRKGVRVITLMVSSDGFYRMSRLYVSPDNFFFKVQLLVLDTYKCSKPCPDIKLGTRYIVMGQIYHRRRHLPSNLLSLLLGKLKPGDGILRSNSYVKRFNKWRHQKVSEATRSRCR